MSAPLLIRRAALVLALAHVVGCGVVARGLWDQSRPPLYDARPPASAAAADRADALSWLARGKVPTVEGLDGSSLVAGALLDLESLTAPYGVTVAGWEPAWRYVWPRDSAFVASAFARTGHRAEAYALLDFLQRVQQPDGVFQARYLPDGSGPPDERGVQLDGTGWALWGLSEVVAREPSADARRATAYAYLPLLERSADALLGQTSAGTRLPAPSADYWETPESRVTLASAAATLMGLRHAAALYSELGLSRSADLAGAAGRFERLVLDSFAADGFPRRLGGSPRSVDLGVSLLLPPFAGVSDPRAIAVWEASAAWLRRPAGGLAPGGSWRRDGVSWTPTTASYAVVAACQDRRAQSTDILRWLDAHRSPSGFLAEKVRADGSPAGVAPLGWTAAAVVITADQLQHGCP